MRRKDKEITDQRIIDDIFASATICRLAMVDYGEPYIVPVNYGYREGTLYIHSASVGRKIDILRRQPRVCFEIESSAVITRHAEPCHWGAKARSIVGYGSVVIVTDFEEKRRGLDLIMAHYGKTDPNLYDERQLAAIMILRVSIESMACKQLGHWDEEELKTSSLSNPASVISASGAPVGPPSRAGDC
jgi:uncharacterized protein